jgi:ribosomal protein S8
MDLEKQVDKNKIISFYIMAKINSTVKLVNAIKTAYKTKNAFGISQVTPTSLNILQCLYLEGLISNYQMHETKVKFTVKYVNDKPLIYRIDSLSTGSLRKFSSREDMKEYYKKYDYFFVATSRGVLSSKQLLHEMPIGGQLLFGLKISS